MVEMLTFEPPSEMVGKCICECDEVYTQSYKLECEYRPRQKDRLRNNEVDCKAYIEVYLCNKHHDAIDNEKPKGWDWWDMVDGLAYGIEKNLSEPYPTDPGVGLYESEK